MIDLREQLPYEPEQESNRLRKEIAMAEVINLRLARKAKQREGKKREAESNRALHGEPGHIKAARKAEEARARREFDAARRETD